jgi:Dyp-type peroxidase family
MGMAESAVNEVAASDVDVALADVQRLVVSPFAHLPWARYHLLRIDPSADLPAARAWLASLTDRIPTAAVRDEEQALAVAFTAEGLTALGTPAGVMATFPRAFRQGMVDEYRTRLLGDEGDSAPERWAWGGPGAEPHVLIAQFAREATPLVDESDALVQAAGAAGLSVDSIDTMLLPDGIEHFGFADGISQPVLTGTDRAGRSDAARWEEIAPGEFILGLVDELGLVADFPRGGGLDLGRHGSYLVVRQIQQHVERFHEHLAAAAAERGIEDVEDLASELVGRRRDGTSLAIGAPATVAGERASNDFGYGEDPLGVGCPIGSHVRRANPRDGTREDSDGARETARRSANRHRLLRRGRPYGPADNARAGAEPRGLLFLAFNADIERQFEFVQHTWLRNPVFSGLSGEIDPITVEQPAEGGSFSIPQRPVRDRLDGLPSFTTTRGGAYFFMPGIEGLRQILSDEVLALE